MKKHLMQGACVSILLWGVFQSASAQAPVADKGQTVTTTGIFSPKETKSGYEINGYYVELSKEQADSLKGKKVSVTGRMIVVKGMSENQSPQVQGSHTDRKFIRDAKITIVYDSREPVVPKK